MSSQVIPQDYGDDYRSQVPRFQLFMTCYNCQRSTSRYMQAVPVDITTEDELIESGLLEKQSYMCGKCECPIGTITGVKVEWIDVPY
jgi:hypothetical protein